MNSTPTGTPHSKSTRVIAISLVVGLILGVVATVAFSATGDTGTQSEPKSARHVAAREAALSIEKVYSVKTGYIDNFESAQRLLESPSEGIILDRYVGTKTDYRFCLDTPDGSVLYDSRTRAPAELDSCDSASWDS